MKKVYAGLAGLIVGPALAMSVAGCGAAAALNKATNPTFSDISLVSASSPLNSAIGSGPTDNSAAPAATVIPAQTQQNLLNDLNGGSITSMDPQIGLTLPGAAGRQAVTGTHVGVLLSTQALSDSQAWSIINDGGSRNLTSGAMAGSITFSAPGSYVFAKTNPNVAGVTYGGDLGTMTGIPPSVHVTGFDGGNAQALGTDFQTLIQQSNGHPINVYVLSYSDTGVTGNVVVNGLTISGQAHINI